MEQQANQGIVPPSAGASAKKHKWGLFHVWGKWERQLFTVTYAWSTQPRNALYQVRTCEVCNKQEMGAI